MKLLDRYQRLTLWNKLGVWGAIASIVGVFLTIILMALPTLRSEQSLDDTPLAGPAKDLQKTRDRKNAATNHLPVLPIDSFAADRQYLAREQSATEIMDNLDRSLKNSGYRDSRMKDSFLHEKVEDLYQGRWVPYPGWVGTISQLPNYQFSVWEVQLKEDGGSALIEAGDIEDDLSSCRIGDAARVAGSILTISRHGRIILTDSIISAECAKSVGSLE